MTRFALSLATLCLLLTGPTASQAVTLTFDDVPGGSVQNSFADVGTYQGFDFSPTLDWIDVVGSFNPYGAHSGDFAVLNNCGGCLGGIITEQFGADFTFDGLWAKRFGLPPESGGANSLFGTLEGYNDGGLVFSVVTGLNGSYQFFGPQAGAIDEFHLGFGNNFLADDIVLNGVPEPSTALLMLLGLGVAARGRKRA